MSLLPYQSAAEYARQWNEAAERQAKTRNAKGLSLLAGIGAVFAVALVVAPGVLAVFAGGGL
ncbi:MAG: hypothetical protein JWR85_3558 [Marmoricola sp.]|nr:hypothetical protein [Marmoricola sp.]